MKEPSIPNRKYFRKENVIVKIPPRGKPVDVVRLDLPADIPMKSPRGGFQPFRLVINLKVVDAAQPDSEVLVFDPPIEVRIRYTPADLACAAAVGKPLSLGFWDGTQWVCFTAEKHNFHLEPLPSPAEGGWGVVSVSHWGDPGHGWGTLDT